ncbi:IS1-like element transposase [Providencia manganoxydans]|uniref:IS1 family transposase n=1 Tax=Providencia manganoxydans TaxID=2923283 RepID=A0ABX7AF08_9GAMM|nr:IS1 family transposase [Providencia manganoxydans]
MKNHELGSIGHQRHRCQDCCRSSQLDYQYHAYQYDTKNRITNLTINNASIRDIARVIHISINTV